MYHTYTHIQPSDASSRSCSRAPFRGTKSRDALLLPFPQANSSSVGFAVISGEALVRVWARDLWWDPLDGLGGGTLGALGLRGQALRRVRTVHLAVHQGKVDVVHVWQHKYFLEDNQNKNCGLEDDKKKECFVFFFFVLFCTVVFAFSPGTHPGASFQSTQSRDRKSPLSPPVWDAHAGPTWEAPRSCTCRAESPGILW